MTIPNYLALYNLSQIEADILIVNVLTATTGTIYTLFSDTGTITTLNSTTGTITTLNSTTGNITTANITTANITTLITDLWRGTSPSSSMVIGASGDSGTLTSWRSLIMEANKTITLSTTGGKILCNVYTGTTASSDITLGESGDTGNLLIYKIINTNLILGTGIQILFTQTGQMSINTIRGVVLTDTISLYLSQTGAINFGNTASTNPLTINNNTILASGKTLTLNATGGKILCNVYTGTTSSSNITIGEVFDSGNLSIYKTIASSNTYTGDNTYSGSNTFSGFNNTFNNTLLCNTFRGLTTAGNISLFSTTTGTLTLGNTGGGNFTINPDVVLASGKNLTLSTTGKVVVDTIEGTAAADNIVLFSTTTGTTTLGNTAGGNFTINPSVVLPANKTITLNATGGKILCNTLTGTATSSTIELGESGDTGLIRTRKD